MKCRALSSMAPRHRKRGRSTIRTQGAASLVGARSGPKMAGGRIAAFGAAPPLDSPASIVSAAPTDHRMANGYHAAGHAEKSCTPVCYRARRALASGPVAAAEPRDDVSQLSPRMLRMGSVLALLVATMFLPLEYLYRTDDYFRTRLTA